MLPGGAAGTAEALAHAPGRALAVLADARPGAPWRAALAIAEPSPRVIDAIESLAHLVQADIPAGGAPAFDPELIAARGEKAGEEPILSLNPPRQLSQAVQSTVPHATISHIYPH